MLPRRCRQHWTNEWKSGHSTVLSSGERMPAVLRSPLSGTRRDVETPFCQESLFAERTTQQKLIAATQNERPFADEQSPPAVITGRRRLAPGRDSPGEQAIEATLVRLTLWERRALLLLALWRGRPRPPGNEASPASISAHRSRLPLACVLYYQVPLAQGIQTPCGETSGGRLTCSPGKRSHREFLVSGRASTPSGAAPWRRIACFLDPRHGQDCCLLYTSDAADEEDSVDLGGRR